FGVAMIMLPFNQEEAFKKVLDAGNAIVLKIVDLIMLAAPYGVFSLMVTLVAEAHSFDVFKALGAYSLTVILGLVTLVYLVYSLFLYFFGKMKPQKFFKANFPAQLLGFSTSSRAATLPVTMDCVEN